MRRNAALKPKPAVIVGCCLAIVTPSNFENSKEENKAKEALSTKHFLNNK